MATTFTLGRCNTVELAANDPTTLVGGSGNTLQLINFGPGTAYFRNDGGVAAVGSPQCVMLPMGVGDNGVPVGSAFSIISDDAATITVRTSSSLGN
jgi:hypothetical protein